ncbi:AMP-binding protein [Salicibibacter cibarius]|uniref:AMP-binding protein n=1 Tax=Salicibibacter cibarius TaxID=2743000 RepID=A0A7T7CA68_9BACI|nr:AMP-binding protein [Salicibibacter cibarius]QQK74579.1 AMP-binding protein [Salicibibacter cibarius]
MDISVVNRVAIGDIIRRSARRFPEKPSLIEDERVLTFKDLDKMCNQFANYLLNSGLEKGDKIATICGNSIEHAVVSCATAKAGMIWVPINPGVGLDEKTYILNETGPKLLIGDAELIKRSFNELSEICPFILFADEDFHGAGNTVQYALENQDQSEPDVHIEDRDVAQIMYTSGTTGNPKGVMISHLAVYISSLGNIIESGYRQDSVALAMMPMFHCAQHAMLTSSLHHGNTVVILKGFEPELFMQTVEKHRVTGMFALPLMYRVLLDHPKRAHYDLSSLEKCMYAMAPMDRTTLERLTEAFDADFFLGTGQTEMYPATMMFKPEEQLRRFGSYWGESSLLVDTAIMDDAGNIVPDGEVGEIVHRGPTVMNGYFNKEEATEKSREYNWHHTGDLGYWDPDGQLVFVDRKKDMIKTGGENVASIKVEETLFLHSKVANASVVGLPHEHWIEAITAFVTPKPGENVTEQEIIDHCAEHLGSFQVPKSVIFLKQLPATMTGKVKKNVLRGEYKNHYLQAPSH